MATITLPNDSAPSLVAPSRRGIVPPSTSAALRSAASPSSRRRLAGHLEDALLLTIVVYVIPVAIILVALPVVLLARGVVEIMSRL